MVDCAICSRLEPLTFKSPAILTTDFKVAVSLSAIWLSECPNRSNSSPFPVAARTVMLPFEMSERVWRKLPTLFWILEMTYSKIATIRAAPITKTIAIKAVIVVREVLVCFSIEERTSEVTLVRLLLISLFSDFSEMMFLS